jgi:hypothetical protein
MAAEDLAGNLLIYINSWLLIIQPTNEALYKETSYKEAPLHFTQSIMLSKKTKYQVIRVLKYAAENLHKI